MVILCIFNGDGTDSSGDYGGGAFSDAVMKWDLEDDRGIIVRLIGDTSCVKIVGL